MFRFLTLWRCLSLLFIFFFNDTATTEIYTLSLHDALPIPPPVEGRCEPRRPRARRLTARSEEHTPELQSRVDLVCRLLLEKKKKQAFNMIDSQKKKKKKQERKLSISQ